MKISLENALGPHAAALQLRSERMQILATNIANADTPGYKARDINFKEALEQVNSGTRSTLYRTTSKHLSGHGLMTTENQLLYRTSSTASVGGNTVESHTEQAQVLRNNLQFQAALRFLNGRFQGMMDALRRDQ